MKPLAVASAALLAACATAPRLPDGGPATASARYRCADGETFAVRFDNRADVAVLRMKDRTATLAGQRPGSGIWYVGEGVEFRGKGREATLSRAGRGSVACVAD